MLAESAEKTETIVGRVREALAKFNWKHALLLSIPLGLYIYPTPLIKLFMPIATKLTGNHPSITCESHLKEIILTPNPEITLAALSKLNFLKGPAPSCQDYHEEECTTIELFPLDRINSIVSSYSGVQLQAASQETMQLYSQALWNNFRLTKLQNPQLRVVLVKASPEILNKFLLKFYRMGHHEAHKMGFLTENRLSILRLDERVGTYEHLVSEFAP